MITAYIALGSNLQNPQQQLHRAIAALAHCATSSCCSVQHLPQPGYGPGDQPHYLNAVAAYRPNWTPRPCWTPCRHMEQAQGRRRELRWGARTLDLDILLYGDQVIDTPRCQVPHPAMQQRNFVLYPLADICRRNLCCPTVRILIH